MKTTSFVLLASLSATLCSAASFYNGQAARAVIGQTAFTDGFAPPSPASNVLGGNTGLAYTNGLLFVADDNRLGASPQNDRIMIFDTRQIAGLRDDLASAPYSSDRCHLCGYAAVGLLGQSDFSQNGIGRTALPSGATGSMNHPVAVATDGRYFAVADTDNNRVLLWNSVPTSPLVAPNVVLGQANFTSFQSPQPVNANSLRGPQGLWIQNGKLFVADTGNYRVLVWNSIPTQNNQPADFALGQPNLISAIHPPDTAVNPTVTASMLSNPAAVTSDGTHVFVTDLGYNRVLIWNSIPTGNGQPADVVVGQANVTTSVSNNNTAVCASTSTDSSGNPQYPSRCEATLSFPRYALAGGGKLFISDSGNDRVLIFNSIPTTNGAKADNVLGQPDFNQNVVTNVAQSIASTTIDNSGSVDTMQAPFALAFDGLNLYVSDPYNRRVLQFAPADTPLPNNSVVNWASEIIRQEGVVVFTGTPVAADTATITIGGTGYTYTVKDKDTPDLVAQGLVSLINANNGDPNAQAIYGGNGSASVYLSSKAFNLGFDAITVAASVTNSTNSTLAATTSGGYLTAGTSATGAPGMLIEINAAAGQTLADASDTSPMPQAAGSLPTRLAGVQVFVDGIATPLVRVSPSQIVAQLFFSISDRSSISIYVRTQHNDGSITVTNPTAMAIAPANPGLFNAPSYSGQTRPWPALGALHQLGNPSAVVSIDGSVQANDVPTITIAGKAYTHTVVAGESLTAVRDALIAAINNAADPNVIASAGAAFNRVVLTARQSGSAGSGITVAGSSTTSATGGTSAVTLTAYTPSTCCNVPQGQPITTFSPAQPGETIVLLGTGLGAVMVPDANQTKVQMQDNAAYIGPPINTAIQSVSATMSGVTAQIVAAGLPYFSFGVYYVQTIVPTTLAANPTTPVYIAQNAYISNTVTIPVGSGSSSVDSGSTTAVALNPQAPRISGQATISPANLVFAVQQFANVSLGSQAVTIQNLSDGNVNIRNIAISGANASDFSMTQNCPGVLNPSGACQVTISFAPAAGGLRSANLVISSESPNSPQIVPIAGTTTFGFSIINQLTGKALEVTGGVAINGLHVTQGEIKTDDFQRWTLVPLGNGQYAIWNVATSKVLDVADFSTSPFATIQQYDYLGGDNQKWNLTPVGNGYYVITNVKSGMALDLGDFSFREGATIQQYPYVGGANQKWKLCSFQTVQIQSLLSGSNIDVKGPSMDVGALIHEWGAGGVLQQQWIFVPIDSTYFKIVNCYSHKVVDVKNYSLANSATIQQWDYNGVDNQLWFLLSQPNGSYSIINKASGKALDITDFSTASGTPIQQYTFTGTSNQVWKLISTAIPGS